MEKIVFRTIYCSANWKILRMSSFAKKDIKYSKFSET